MDMFMPVMDGVEAASKIAALNTGTPIIATTANVMENEPDKYKKTGISSYLEKPFTSQQLWNCLLKYLKPAGVSVEEKEDEARDSGTLLKKLKTTFVRDNREKFAEINTAITAGDLKLAHRLAHTLKGNADLIKEPGLRNAAEDMEKTLNEGKIPSAGQMGALESELTPVLEKLKSLPDESVSAVGQNNPDREQALALFEQLKIMVENMNPESVNLLDKIRDLPGTGELVYQIENYDFHSASLTLEELKKDWL